MAQVIAFTLEVDGVELIFKNLAELKKFTKDVNNEFQNADKGTEKYKILQKTLGSLKEIQKQNTQATRNAGRAFVVAADKGKNSYRAMNAELVNLRDRFKNLSDIERKSKIGTDIIKNITKLDTELKQIDSSIGNFQRNVGNYRQALIGIGDVVTGGLLTGGITQIAQEVSRVIKGAIDSIKEFEVAQKELQSITGLTNEGLEELSKSALDISARFGTAAVDVLKGFQIIGSKKPELLSSAAALAQVTEQAEILSKATGLTLPEAADVLTKSLNQFGAGADSAREFVDILATSQQKGTATAISLGESLKNVGSVLDASNITFEQGNVLLQALAKGGLEGAEAGTKLRAVLVRLAKTNREELNPATNDFNDILDILATEITSVSAATEVFGLQNGAAALTLIKQRDVVRDLTGNLSEYGNALGQAINNTDTLQGSLDKASASFDNFVLSLQKGDGALSRFSKGVVNTFTGLFGSLRAVNDGLVEDVDIGVSAIKLLVNPLAFFRDAAESSFVKAGSAAGRLRLELDKLSQELEGINDPIERQEKLIIAQGLSIKLLEERLTGVSKGTSEYTTVVQVLEKAQKSLIVQQNILAAQLNPIAEQNKIVVKGLAETGASVEQIAKDTGLALTEVAKILGVTIDKTTELTAKQKANVISLKKSGLSAEEVATETGIALAEITKIFKSIKIGDSLEKEVDKAAKNIERLTKLLARLGAIETIQNQAQLTEGTERRIQALVGTPEQVTKQTELLRLQLEIELAKLQRADFKAQLDGIEILIPIKITGLDDSIPKQVKDTITVFLNQLDKEIGDNSDEVEKIVADLAGSLNLGLEAAAQNINGDGIVDAFDAIAQRAKEALTISSGELLDKILSTDAFAGFEEAFDLGGLGETIQGIIGEDDTALKIAGVFDALSIGIQSLESASERRLENDLRNIESRYAREIKLASGNSKKIAKLERDKDKEIRKVEKEAFERSKRIKIAAAGTSLASGIINVFAAPTTIPDPFGTIFKAAQVALLLTTFAQQVAAIGAAKFATGGFTGKGFGIPDETGHKPAGVVHADEYVVTKKKLQTKRGKELVGELEKLNAGDRKTDFYRSRGFYVDGGIVNTQLDPKIPIQSVQVINNVVSTEASFSEEQLETLGGIIEEATKAGVIEGMVEAEEEITLVQERVTRLEETLN